MRPFASPEDEKDLTEHDARLCLCEMGRRMWLKDMCDANGGNHSCRLNDKRILATPTGISKGFMQPEDLVVLDLAGNQLSGHRRSTSEIFMHLVIYRERPDIQAVAHAHPRHATAFALAHQVPPEGLLPEVELLIGKIGLAPYQTPGTVEFAESLAPLLHQHSVLLLANHGAVAMGRGILEAYWRLEVLESCCATCLLARQLGGAQCLDEQAIGEIRQLRQKFGL